MKKTKFIALASLLLVGLVACGGDTQPSESQTPASSQTPTSQSSEAPASQTPASEAPASQSSEAPASQSSEAPTSQAPATEKGFADFVEFTNAVAKDQEATQTIGIFTVTRGKSKPSNGKTFKGTGSKSGYKFMGSAQLGKKGTSTDKCITFTLSSPATVEVYGTRGTTGMASGNLTVEKDGAAIAESPLVFMETITMCKFEAQPGNYSMYVADDVSSINVFGIAVL